MRLKLSWGKPLKEYNVIPALEGFTVYGEVSLTHGDTSE